MTFRFPLVKEPLTLAIINGIKPNGKTSINLTQDI